MSRSIFLRFLAALFFLFPLNQAGAVYDNPLIIAGWVEEIVLAPSQTRYRAKLDTGAKTSSIHALHIEEFERDGQQWVRFQLPRGQGKKSKETTLEVPLYRKTLIKRHKLDSAKRYVVELGFCMDSQYYETQFTLADRSNFIYPVLLGRRFLENKVIVDSAVTHKYSKNIKNIVCTPEFGAPVTEE